MKTLLGFALCLFVIAPFARAEDVDSPAYQSWAKQKIGTKVSTRAETVTATTNVSMEMTQTLAEITPTKIVLDMAITIEMMGTKQIAPAQKMEIPVKATKSLEAMPASATSMKDLVIKETGKESIEVAGKKYECVIHEFEGTTTQGKMAGKIWNTPLIPGNVAKMESTITGKTNATSKTTVTSIEIK